MPEKAQAGVLVGPRKVEIQEFDLPETKDDDALLRIEACGICGSDVPPYQGEIHGEVGPLPVILGHEITGRVQNLGRNAAARWGVEEGDRIILERWLPCGSCELCRNGYYRICRPTTPAGGALNYGGTSINHPPYLWGGYADYMYLASNSVVFKVSKDIPAEWLPLFTPIANGISWTQRTGGTIVGSTTVIQGPGQMGQGCVIAAKEAGARQIIVTGLTNDAKRLELAMEMGATHTIMVDEEDAVAKVNDITEGKMADVVLDVTSGSTEPINMAMELAGFNGTVVLAAGHGGPVPNFNARNINRKMLTVKGVSGRDRNSILVALRLIESRKYDLDKLCTHEYPVEQTAEALATTAREVDTGVEPVHVCVVPGHPAA